MLVTVLSTMSNGTVTQQLHFFFDLFDLNGDGLLQVCESNRLLLDGHSVCNQQVYFQLLV